MRLFSFDWTKQGLWSFVPRAEFLTRPIRIARIFFVQHLSTWKKAFVAWRRTGTTHIFSEPFSPKGRREISKEWLIHKKGMKTPLSTKERSKKQLRKLKTSSVFINSVARLSLQKQSCFTSPVIGAFYFDNSHSIFLHIFLPLFVSIFSNCGPTYVNINFQNVNWK